MKSVTNLLAYGDEAEVPQDAKTIREILNRQGTNFLIHCIAEYIGQCALDFKMSEADVKRVKDGLAEELKESIAERT